MLVFCTAVTVGCSGPVSARSIYQLSISLPVLRAPRQWCDDRDLGRGRLGHGLSIRCCSTATRGMFFLSSRIHSTIRYSMHTLIPPMRHSTWRPSSQPTASLQPHIFACTCMHYLSNMRATPCTPARTCTHLPLENLVVPARVWRRV